MKEYLRRRWRKRPARPLRDRPAYFDEDDFDAIGGGCADQPKTTQ